MALSFFLTPFFLFLKNRPFSLSFLPGLRFFVSLFQLFLPVEDDYQSPFWVFLCPW